MWAARGRSAPFHYSRFLGSGRLPSSSLLSLGMQDTEPYSGPSAMDPAFIAFMGFYERQIPGSTQFAGAVLILWKRERLSPTLIPAAGWIKDTNVPQDSQRGSWKLLVSSFLLSLLNSIGPQEGFASEMGDLELFSMKTSDQSSVSQGLSKTLRGLGSTQ